MSLVGSILFFGFRIICHRFKLHVVVDMPLCMFITIFVLRGVIEHIRCSKTPRATTSQSTVRGEPQRMRLGFVVDPCIIIT